VTTGARSSRSTRRTRGGDFYLATSGDLHLATSGDFFMAMDKWVGRELRIGDGVVLAITDHCPRCVMTTLPQGDLPKDNGILRTAARHNGVHVGVYGEVRHAGRVQRGDAASLS